MLDKVVFFLFVVRYNSFSEAAKQYGISSSAGSRWIVELEENMGVNLLKRTTRKLTLTQAGQKLYDRFSNLNQEIVEVFDEIQNIGNETKGLIKVASTPLFTRYYLATVIGEFLQQHPQIRFKIIETPFETDCVETVDFAIRAKATYQGYQEKDSLLIKRFLFKEPLITCCSPLYIERFSEPKHPDELSKHNCLYASSLVGGNRWIFEKNDEFTSIKIPQTIEVDNSETLKGVALVGGGIVYLPKSLVDVELTTGRLVQIMQDYTCGDFEIDLYYRPRKQMPTRCVSFKDYLVKRIPEIRKTLKYHNDYFY